MTKPTSDLVTRLRNWFTKTAGASLLSFCIELNPVPASRPRVTRWGTYYAKTYKVWKNEAEQIAEKIGKDLRISEGPVAALMEFVVQRPKTTKRRWPRGDGDNYEKAILDALTDTPKEGITRVLKDDDNVVLGIWTKRYAEEGETPGCYVQLFPLKDH